MTRYQADALWAAFASVPRLVELAEFAACTRIVTYSFPRSQGNWGWATIKHSEFLRLWADALDKVEGATT